MQFNYTDYLIPGLVLLLLIAAYFKRINTYDAFVKGASRAIELAYSLFPYVAAVLIMVQLLRVSGITAYIATAVTPVFGILGIPSELVELVLIRPFTSSGSIAILNDIYATHGADSYIGRSASAVMSSSETVFYVTAVYFSASKARKLRYCVPVALTASLTAAVIACLLCRIF